MYWKKNNYIKSFLVNSADFCLYIILRSHKCQWPLPLNILSNATSNKAEDLATGGPFQIIKASTQTSEISKTLFWFSWMSTKLPIESVTTSTWVLVATKTHRSRIFFKPSYNSGVFRNKCKNLLFWHAWVLSVSDIWISSHITFWCANVLVLTMKLTNISTIW